MIDRHFDAVIVGAGFAGMYMLHRLRAMGFSARVFEAGSGVGGTWYWNRYPGARCDVESMEYSYQFCDELQQEWRWSERYAAQPEILRYASHVADRFDLRRDIQFDTRVAATVYDEAGGRWLIQLGDGPTVTAAYCIMATGCLSSTNTPNFKSLDAFKRPCYHTGRWPHEGVDFAGRRVGIIGTGSSAIQSIPIIAQEAKHLFVFQRTPNYAVPARNAPMDPEFERRFKANYAQLRAQARQARTGNLYPISERPASEASEEEREREYQDAQPWPRADRSNRGGRGCLGCARQRGRRADPVPVLQLVVPRREHPRQAASFHAVPRLSGLRAEMQRGRAERVRGLQAEQAVVLSILQPQEARHPGESRDPERTSFGGGPLSRPPWYTARCSCLRDRGYGKRRTRSRW